MTKKQFKSRLEALLDAECEKLIDKKPFDKPFLSYGDIRALSVKVRQFYRTHCSEVPGNVRFHCEAAEAILAPDLASKIAHIKAMVGVAGGVTGLAAVITGLAGIFGWGAGALTAIKIYFVGAALGGPIAWIAGGITVASVAAYFAVSSDDEEKSKRAFEALKKGAFESADKMIWPLPREQSGAKRVARRKKTGATRKKVSKTKNLNTNYEFNRNQ